MIKKFSLSLLLVVCATGCDSSVTFSPTYPEDVVGSWGVPSEQWTFHKMEPALSHPTMVLLLD